MVVVYVVVVLQRISVEEHFGADFTYAVVERQLSTDRWSVVDALSSERSSCRHPFQGKPVDLAIISRNEIGESSQSAVFSISLASVLCQFSSLSFFCLLIIGEIVAFLSPHICAHTHTHNRFTALWILSGTTWVSRYQKKHSPTHTYRGRQSSLICLIHLL